MANLAELNSIALACGYDSREEMLELSKLDPETIHDEDERTWPERKVARVITVECLAGGGFTVREEDKFCDRLCWDEMLGHLASMTMPPGGRMYPMVTKEQRDAEIERRKERDNK